MKRPALWIAATVLLVAAALTAVLATRSPAVTKIADSPLIGRIAPDVSGKALDGATVRLADLRGSFVVLNFFATWCIPCQREHPELVRFSQQHAADGSARVLQVIFDDTAAAARDFGKTNQVDWPVVEDPDGQVALDFGVRGPPESFLIGPDGLVLFKIVGQVDAAGLNRLLNEVAR
ncbi:MAG TPA: TlpA disulfide reductase family protein [Acidimicrobiales bacterium]|nr:TlpA disulfide reductase family protein [Acidimicrobiales bacterium]